MRDLQIARLTRQTSAPPQASLRGLDWFVFFVANLQTGFGPFLATYLTRQLWTHVDIGLIFSIGSIVSLLSQVPGGWLVDTEHSKIRITLLLAVVTIGVSAFLIAAIPEFSIVVIAQVLHVLATSVLVPGIAAVTLGLVGHAVLHQRLGRNTRVAAIGNALGALSMGAVGYLASAQAALYVIAALAIPTLFAILRIRQSELDVERIRGGVAEDGHAGALSLDQLFRKPALLGITISVLFFHVSNAGMLPLVGSVMVEHSGRWASLLVASIIVGPQLVVAMISPTVSQLAETLGRRNVLLMAFAALAARGALLGLTSNPILIVAVQLLDGISGAVLGILVPLIIADITRGTGRYNFAQGVAGSATGVGAAVSTFVAGYVADHLGVSTAFAGLAAMGFCGFAFVLYAMPETKPKTE